MEIQCVFPCLPLYLFKFSYKLSVYVFVHKKVLALLFIHFLSVRKNNLIAPFHKSRKSTISVSIGFIPTVM